MIVPMSVPKIATAAWLCLLATCCVCAPALAQGVSGGRLPTRWDAQVSPTAPLPEYPRPQMTRDAWQSLNGRWDYALAASDSTTPPPSYSGKILVPFPYESALSGVGAASPATQRLWYRREFAVPAAWHGQRILLHFGAVNWDSAVFVNGRRVGAHTGGYDGFDLDITDALKPGGENELVVSAFNPLRSDTADAQALGKQRLHPSGIFYTASTGIWQTVWIEPVPAAHVDRLILTPDLDKQTLQVTVDASGAASASAGVKLQAMDGAKVVGEATGVADVAITLPIESAHLWSPSDPHLYTLRISLTRGGKSVDTVGSYFAMRKISLGKDARGRTCICLNNRPFFLVGALDQGYWPDGIYTAPTDAALRSDIDFGKQMGFNTLRKHAKVEPERWYYWTDKLGVLVLQDMPQCFAGPGGALTDDAKAQWLMEWRREIAARRNHPSIVVWTLFNEGWGQHDMAAIADLTRRLDPSRLIDDASGWNDVAGVGDIRDTHAYPGPWSELPEASRAAINGEFGGVTSRVPDHMWTSDVFGYGATLGSSWQATKKYQALLKAAYAIHETRGTSAVIYTQLTDVESESNGLLTYDRSMIKTLPKITEAANRGSFPPLPPDPHPDTSLVPTSALAPHAWQYTTQQPAGDWMQPAFDAAGWQSGNAPFGQGYANIGTPWTATPGDIWLRRTLTLPASLPKRLNAIVEHDEDVEVYLNGVPAASATGFTSDYVSLPISAAAVAALHSGANVIAVHCRQTVGGQVIDVGLAAAP